MTPHDFHTFVGWLIIVGAVCLTVAAGALIDRLFINRRYRPAACRQSARRIKK